MQNVLDAHGFLSMKWFMKGEVFTSCFNFDLNQSGSKKKMCSKMSIFLALSKNVSPLVNDNEQGPSGVGGGGGWAVTREKLRTLFYIERNDYIFLSCKQIFNC